MARSIAEIKGVMTGEFMASEEMQIKYGFKAGDKWEDTFSKVSVENILFYVFAASLYVVERLFDTHKTDVGAMLDTMLPHTARWYREKALAFMYLTPLIDGTDRYDTAAMTQSKIEELRVVKYAAVVEDIPTSTLTVKVAADNKGSRGPLDDEQLMGLTQYLERIKDAGVKIEIINKEADKLDISADIAYDPLMDKGVVEDACIAAIKGYVENLPFNGQFSNMGLVDVLQLVQGVTDVYITVVKAIVNGSESVIEGRSTPVAGYYKTGTITLNMTDK